MVLTPPMYSRDFGDNVPVQPAHDQLGKSALLLPGISVCLHNEALSLRVDRITCHPKNFGQNGNPKIRFDCVISAAVKLKSPRESIENVSCLLSARSVKKAIVSRIAPPPAPGPGNPGRGAKILFSTSTFCIRDSRRFIFQHSK